MSSNASIITQATKVDSDERDDAQVGEVHPPEPGPVKPSKKNKDETGDKRHLTVFGRSVLQTHGIAHDFDEPEFEYAPLNLQFDFWMDIVICDKKDSKPQKVPGCKDDLVHTDPWAKVTLQRFNVQNIANLCRSEFPYSHRFHHEKDHYLKKFDIVIGSTPSSAFPYASSDEGVFGMFGLGTTEIWDTYNAIDLPLDNTTTNVLFHHEQRKIGPDAGHRWYQSNDSALTAVFSYPDMHKVEEERKLTFSLEAFWEVLPNHYSRRWFSRWLEAEKPLPKELVSTFDFSINVDDIPVSKKGTHLCAGLSNNLDSASLARGELQSFTETVESRVGNPGPTLEVRHSVYGKGVKQRKTFKERIQGTTEKPKVDSK